MLKMELFMWLIIGTFRGTSYLFVGRGGVWCVDDGSCNRVGTLLEDLLGGLARL